MRITSGCDECGESLQVGEEVRGIAAVTLSRLDSSKARLGQGEAEDFSLEGGSGGVGCG